MILVIDNYDSFVANLARYFELLGKATHIVRNDRISISEIRKLQPEAILISPGPRAPADAGISLEVVQEFLESIPILGVCLGHQVIGEALGGRTIKASEPMHGRQSTVEHKNHPLFQSIPARFDAGRYHSLTIDPLRLPAELQVLATTADGTIMAIGHQSYPTFGLQFHPESILTTSGFRIISNFLACAGLQENVDPVAIQTPASQADITEVVYPGVARGAN